MDLLGRQRHLLLISMVCLPSLISAGASSYFSVDAYDYSSILQGAPLPKRDIGHDLILLGLHILLLVDLLLALLISLALLFRMKGVFWLCLGSYALPVLLYVLPVLGKDLPDKTLMYLYVVLDLSTRVALLLTLRSADAGRPTASWEGLTRAGTGIVFSVSCIILAGMGLTIVELRQMAPPKGERMAPVADFETRRTWGIHTFKKSLIHVAKYIRESKVIDQEIGMVKDFAPVEGPNYVQPCFTDGCYTVLYLELIGERGNATLSLPHVTITDYQEQEYGELLTGVGDARLTVGGKILGLDRAGELSPSHRHSAAALGTAELLLSNGQYRALADAFNVRDGVMSHPDPGLLQNLFLRAVRAMADDGQLKPMIQALETSSALFKWREYDQPTPLSRRDRATLSTIHAILRDTNDKGDEEQKSYFARLAFFIQRSLELNEYVPASDNRAPFEEAQFLPWSKRHLGPFYDVPVGYLTESIDLSRRLGTPLQVALGNSTEIKLTMSQGGRYSAFLGFSVEGPLGKAQAIATIEEDHCKTKPLRPFVIPLRKPSEYLLFTKLNVTFEGGIVESLLEERQVCPK